ncbi:hypothetical protein FHR99_002491 [Litorivivens lipolytica]|uniref:Uncharacterized protein n=1 Tax=Litorivivens lipolytica TaxID=1524264 RepID=A0A7W4W683_9GAMM|nr:hypothetical protein [Litorivivens lipolytica]MBB3048217.1 hypothetical protein [Litorivivens lipolytica]
MRLRYPLVSAEHDQLLLENSDGWRVEMYILQNNDDSYSLVALSGKSGGVAERTKLQGPYLSRALAHAALSAIENVLLSRNFTKENAAHPQWRLTAQREIKSLRTTRQQNTPDCRFDPRDVY